MFFSAELPEASSVLLLICFSGFEITTTLASLLNASICLGVKPLELPSLESFSPLSVLLSEERTASAAALSTSTPAARPFLFSVFIPKRSANPFLFFAVRTISLTAPAAFAAARPILLSADGFLGLFSTPTLDGLPSCVSLILWWFPFAFCVQNGNKLMYT